jgi:AcrR family transcriptional regulator
MAGPANHELEVTPLTDVVPRRHTDQGEERKQQLLDAAADLFSAKGYTNTRIIDICERAGVAKGLFYWYFQTKESLFAELVRSMRQRLRRVQADAMDPDASALERIRQAAIASMLFLSEHEAYFALLDDDSTSEMSSLVVREGQTVYAEDTERLVREAQTSGHALDWLDPALASIGVVSAIGAFSQLVRTTESGNDPQEIAQFAADWVVRALSGM